MENLEKKIIPFQSLQNLSKKLKKEKNKIITTNGCFDILHLGHIQYLIQARRMGDVLIVGVNSDNSVKKIKGNNRPLQSEKVRALQLAGLESVNYISIFDEDTPLEFIKNLEPYTHVKGSDYANKDIPEKRLVESLGGKMAFVEYLPGFSTTEIIKRIQSGAI